MISLRNVPLFVTDASYLFFFTVTVVFGLWVYLKSSRKKTHTLFLLLCLSVGIYQISHVFGITVENSEASRLIFNSSLSLIFVIGFTIHWIASILEREKDYKGIIWGTYGIGTLLVAFYLLVPNAFLYVSTPKSYFPNYYSAGDFYWVLIAYFAYGFGISMHMLLKGYRMADALHRNRLAYYMTALLIGFPLASFGFFLSYGIDIDPIFSIPFNFFILPLAYGVLRYDILDLRAAARKAFGYTIFVMGTALFILGAHVVNAFVETVYPYVPQWIVPLSSALVVVFFSGYVWERMKDVEILKYEFITVVTHKFRTPLTRIKWASEIIKKHAKIDEDERQAVAEIESANENLVELTDILVDLHKADESGYLYEYESSNLCLFIDKVIKNVRKHAEDKKIILTVTCPQHPVFASIDQRRMLFALQILVDNAVTYTPQGGKVTITVLGDNSDALIQVKDSGIGISKDDLSKIFNKFWRSREAKTTDTEGMGIGLFMAREIVERHDGQIRVDSAGLDQGATFTIRLPIASQE